MFARTAAEKLRFAFELCDTDADGVVDQRGFCDLVFSILAGANGSIDRAVVDETSRIEFRRPTRTATACCRWPSSWRRRGSSLSSGATSRRLNASRAHSDRETPDNSVERQLQSPLIYNYCQSSAMQKRPARPVTARADINYTYTIDSIEICCLEQI